MIWWGHIFICNEIVITVLYLVYDIKFINMYNVTSVYTLTNDDKFIGYVNKIKRNKHTILEKL